MEKRDPRKGELVSTFERSGNHGQRRKTQTRTRTRTVPTHQSWHSLGIGWAR